MGRLLVGGGVGALVSRFGLLGQHTNLRAQPFDQPPLLAQLA